MAPADLTTLKNYKALVFDCYGTLIDWETGIYNSLAPLFKRSGKGSADRAAILAAFGSVEHEIQAQFPSMLYSDVLARVYMTLAARLQDREPPSESTTLRADDAAANTDASTPTPADPEEAAARAFAESVETWPPFPDTVPALASLAQRFRLVILSNIDRATITKTRAHMEGPGAFAFSAVYTAQDVGAYKPAPEMLAYALRKLKEDFGIEQDEVLMTAQSVFHDILPAKGRGMATAWINREGAITGLPESTTDVAMFTFPTMGAMAEAVEEANV